MLPEIKFMPIVSRDELRALTLDILKEAGANLAVAERVADHLVDSNAVGMDSHGVLRVPSYVKWLSEGKIARDDRIEVFQDCGATAVLDAHSTFGPMAALRAANMALNKAQEHGIGLVAVRNSSHTGRLGEYVEHIAREGCVGFMCCNAQGAGQVVASWGGRAARLSTNPLAWGIPTSGDPMVLDMATSAASEGKIRVKWRRKEKLPAGWAISAEGNPVTDPSDFYGPPMGAILSAGHKGYGLALVVDILAGALTGGGCARPVDHLHTPMNGFVVMAINVALFREVREFVGAVDDLFKYVKSGGTLDPGGKVLIPNEVERNERRRRLTEGIELDDETWRQIVESARGVGIEVEFRAEHDSQNKLRWWTSK
jgi:hydroxycarboxylate dehydrogenase B